jgi:effector-binding domain-containing protein
MELIEPPRVVARTEASYFGIRVVTPFRGMLRVRDELLSELNEWLHARGIEASPFFFRLNVVDMNGPMDLEVGAVTKDSPAGDDRVTKAVLPAGDYATLTYRDHARRANGALIDWAAANDIRFDSEVVPAGDRFACRYEAYLTDPFTEPRKTKWVVELNIRLAD